MKSATVFRCFAAFLILILALATVTPGYSASQEGKVRVWVQFQPGQKAAVEGALRGNGAEIHYAFDDLNAFAVSLPEKALDGIRHNPNVVLVEEDAPRYVSAETVPFGIDMVQARQIWDGNNDGVVDAGAPNGSGRTVCVIDSGVDTQHEDLAGVNFVGGYPADYNRDRCGHGTHVTGTIAAANNALGVVGVAPGGVSVYAVKVFGDDCGWTYSSTLVDAANRCVAAGANVINMSLGGPTASSIENKAFTNLYNQGVLPIASAGNDGNTALNYPAGYSSVVSVAAVDQDKAVADFSQQNADVELAAPGVGVLSTVPFVNTHQVTVEGTTYSANHVEYAAYGNAAAPLVDGGLCGTTSVDWAGKVVLCQRGDYDFFTKVNNVQNSNGVAAILYNNATGNFLGTLGDGNTSAIPAISLSMEDGAYLVANKLGTIASVTSGINYDADGYEAWDGTSMAAPHVTGVAALVWSANPGWTNAQIRQALTATAQDLGAAGRDNAFGYGLVQAQAACQYLGGCGAAAKTMTVAVATNKASYVTRETVTITVTVKDQNGAAVGGASVALKITTANGAIVQKTGVTGTNGVVTFTHRVDSKKQGAGAYTINATATKAGYLNATGTKTFSVTR